MKSFLLSLALVTGMLSGTSAQNQHGQRLADVTRSTPVTGYGAAVGKLTQFNGELAAMAGMQGGVTINHLSVGIGAYGLATNHRSSEPGTNGNRVRWNLNYGGLLLDYTILPQGAIHVTIGTLLGPGYVYKSERGSDLDNDGDLDGRPFDQSWCAIAEPQFNIEAAVFRWMRIAVGGSYRFARGVETSGITDKKLSAPSGNLTLKFGRF
ncbi:hypothetical protein GCM10023189_51900 [Nibrella saemangeumensis]|uniref:Outer membrane protein beta-barrel domain-containing protein n=1 Tax=Nibrella saemangeumensis TaxID=1084526 RepID=A0ABP8NK78_9BACT